MTSKSAATAGSETANLHEDVEDQSTASRKTTGPTMMSDAGRKLSSAALRRELWRDNQQQSIEDQPAGSFARTTTYGEVSHVVQQQQPRNVGTTGPGDHVFKFDSFDRDRYLSGSSSTTSRCESSEASTMVAGTPSTSSNVLMVHNDDQPTSEDIFSPASGRSPHSSMSSPHVSVDSPRICFSPLRIKDSIEEEDHHNHHHHHHLPKLSVRGCESPLPPAAHHGGGLIPAASTSTSNCWLEPNHAKYMPGGLSRPISPNPSITPTTPISPSTTPLHALRHIPAYLTEVYRRRCLSDTDLSASWDDLKGAATNRSGQQQQGQQQHLHGQYSLQQNYQKTLMQLPGSRHLPLLSQKGGSLESEASSTTTQESPLDLSVRSSVSSTTGIMALKRPLAASMDSIQTSTASTRGPLLAGKGRSRSSTSRSSGGERDRYPDRFSLDRLDVVEVAGSGGASNSNSDVAYVCPICGQMFSLHDRLAKHMASRHKSRSTDSGSKAYLCDVCRRSFARSDMLTRHMRLHTGIKPYTCRVCGQVFSRSDHLSTHQRTHTGEKPYRCPTCPYAACRRDMITRYTCLQQIFKYCASVLLCFF
jgi:DNA-directed RNA polymerase subunit RPC12/RpoP